MSVREQRTSSGNRVPGTEHTWPELVVEKDVPVPVRDGSTVYVDVFRALGAEPLPVILSQGPYGKDVAWLDGYPDHGVDVSPWGVWETPDPGWWAPHGYALARADSRGIERTAGVLDPLSNRDTEDFYDVIEWLGSQAWCNGKVGLSGVSFYAITQWKVAALRPPHLAAIIPWEGGTDLYRDWLRQGGIFANSFVDFWWQLHYVNQPVLTGEAVDWRAEGLSRELDDAWYHERSAVLEDIDVPVLSAGNWGAFHIHLRGNVEGFSKVRSANKRLVMMTGTHIDPFYSEWGKREQLRFFDRWLRGEDNGVEDAPPVRLAVRRGHEIAWRDEDAWPVARTTWATLHLDASRGSLEAEPPASPSTVRMESPVESVSFTSAPVTDRTEVLGGAELTLWVSTTAKDVDVFVSVRHLLADGSEAFGVGPRGGPVPMAVGWLRASHRAVDTARCQPGRPWHRHDEVAPVVPGEPFELNVEIWPTSMVLKPGDRLVVEVSSNDVHMSALGHNHPQDRSAERFAGEVVVHSGRAHPSVLTLPVVPVDEAWWAAAGWAASAPEASSAADLEPPGVRCVPVGARWAVEIERYGQISGHATKEAAVAAAVERATRMDTWYQVVERDGTSSERQHPRGDDGAG